MPSDPRSRYGLTPALVAGHATPANWVLSPRGDQVAFTFENAGAQQLFVLPSQGGWARLITPGLVRYGRPSWSPDGRRLVSVSGTTLYRMNDDGTDAVVLHEHPAGVQEPVWSPDGATIAFRSRERGWDQIWSIPFSGGRARRLTQHPADNESPRWSPGARYIAYTSIRDTLTERNLYLVDSATGQETNLTAGFGCLNVAPAWSTASAELAFFSERDGFFHLYVRGVRGGIRQLTEGAWEDGGMHARPPQHLCWSPVGDAIAFIRNRDGKLDVMVVDATGGGIRRISPGDGNWGIVGWLPDGKHLLATFDSPSRPPDLWRLSAAGGDAEQLTFSAGGIPVSRLVEPARASFTARDGRSIGGYLYRPCGLQDGEKAPAIVVVHGGPNSQFGYAWRPVFQLFAQEGYAVFGVDFRGSTGYGREFRQANFGEWGNADLWDVIDAAAYLRGLDWVDSERIAIYGGSYGGYLVLCALTRSPETFRCGIDLYGDSELVDTYRHGDRVGRRDLQRQMGSPDQDAALFRERSPLYSAQMIEAPLLIMHGRDDRRVPVLMSERMVEALTIEGKFVEHRFYEGEAHGFQQAATREDSLERTLKFLRRHLRGEHENA